MPRDTIRQWANLLAMLGALTVNVLANALPLNGLNTGQISDRFKVFFVPAGYVFSIWGLIYIGWIAFIVWQFRPANKTLAPHARAGILVCPQLRLQRRLALLLALSAVRRSACSSCWPCWPH